MVARLTPLRLKVTSKASLDRSLDENKQGDQREQGEQDDRKADSFDERAEGSRHLPPDQIPGEDDRPQQQSAERPAQRLRHAASVRVEEHPNRAKHLEPSEHEFGLDQAPTVLGEPGRHYPDQEEGEEDEPG